MSKWVTVPFPRVFCPEAGPLAETGKRLNLSGRQAQEEALVKGLLSHSLKLKFGQHCISAKEGSVLLRGWFGSATSFRESYLAQPRMPYFAQLKNGRAEQHQYSAECVARFPSSRCIG